MESFDTSSIGIAPSALAAGSHGLNSSLHSNGIMLDSSSSSGTDSESDDSPEPAQSKLLQNVAANDSQQSILSPSGTSLRRGMACSFCRRRKLRCSGEKPTCSMCIKYKQSCEYAQIPPKGRKKKDQKEDTTTHPEAVITSESTSRHDTPSVLQQPTMPDLSYSSTEGYHSSSSLSQQAMTDTPPMSFMPSTDPGSSAGYGSYPNGQFVGATDISRNSMFSSTDSSNPFDPSIYQSSTNGLFSSIPFNMDYTQMPQMDNPIPWQFPTSTSQMTDDTTMWTPNPNANMNPPVMEQPHNTSSGPMPDQSMSTPQQLYTATSATPNLEMYPSQRFDPARDTPTAYQVFGPSPFANQDSAYRNTLLGQIPSQHASSSSGESPNPDLATAHSHNMNIGSIAKHPSRTAHSRRSSRSNPMIDSIESASITNTSRIDPVEGITERLGEFLFNPKEHDNASSSDKGPQKRRKAEGSHWQERGDAMTTTVESDGLSEGMRELLIDCFLAHSKLFFELSIPRFRYRMQFRDRRRPSLALLNAMYLWATRMSHSPNMVAMEQKFFTAACRALDLNSANGDRLIDCMRAAMLLGAWSFVSGRFHEGWILSGMAVRLAFSTGLHKIKSLVFKPEPPLNPFVRNQVHLLPPVEDATDLGERIHTFWAVFLLDRCGATATGFPVGFRDEDISTPFPRPLPDIISGAVTADDDVTIKDLYRSKMHLLSGATWYSKWCKSVTILERASKLAFLTPDTGSEHHRAWSNHLMNPASPRPPAWLEQPKYRNPRDYQETILGLEQIKANMGSEGICPLERFQQAKMDAVELPRITPHTVMLHHQFCCTQMLLHDVNSTEYENEEALSHARRSVRMIREGPIISPPEIDSFTITVWSITCKVLIKEVRRLFLRGDMAGLPAVEADVDSIIEEMHKVGQVMQLARTQAKAMQDMRDSAKSPTTAQSTAETVSSYDYSLPLSHSQSPHSIKPISGRASTSSTSSTKGDGSYKPYDGPSIRKGGL